MPDALRELRKFVAPETIFGDGARKVCGAYAERIGMRRVLLVTDPGIIEAGWVEPLLDDLAGRGIDVVVFSDVSPNPRSAQVAHGAEVCRENGCSAIVAIGGGSPMDCAKGIGIVVSNGGAVLDYAGVDRVEIPMPPLICIPTTAGTGAGCVPFAHPSLTRVTRVPAGLLASRLCRPSPLSTPVVLSTMDAGLTAATGMDALVHAIEAFVSNGSWEMTDALALSAIRSIPDALPGLCADANAIEHRRTMALASLNAGLAFSNASLGAVHALAHALGGRLDSPHGECNALLLGPVMRRNLRHVPAPRLAMLAGAVGIAPDDAAARLPVWFDGLRVRLGIESEGRGAALSDADFESIARAASMDACMATNPYMPTTDELVEILHEALD